MKYLSRLRALIAVLFTRTFEATLPNGARVHVYPWEQVVLPAISGGAPEGDADADGDSGDDSGGDDDSGDAGDSDSGDDDADKGGDDDSGDADADKGGKDAADSEWKGHARRHEREAKKARKRAKELEDQLKNLKDKDKTDQEKALEKARDEAKSEAKSEYDKSLRSSRLEVSVTRLASKGIKVGEGDDAKTVKFADSEDALVHIERAIDKGDIDPEDIFDSEGKVKVDALTSELTDLLDSKPHLAGGSGSGGEGKKKKTADGDADGGKGKGAGKSLDELSVEEHVKRLDNRDK